MKIVRRLNNKFKGGWKRVYRGYCKIATYLKLWLNGVEFGSGLQAHGIPIIYISDEGKFSIGKNFVFKSGRQFNQIGRPHPTYFTVRYNGVLKIGDNVSISNIAIVCEEAVTIHNNVRIGANVVIYDSNFHSSDVNKRISSPEDKSDVVRMPVIIGDGAFIGSHSIILKGVHIGNNSIVGAGSVVTKDIPPNEVWAGNPAKFIKTLDTNQVYKYSWV